MPFGTSATSPALNFSVWPSAVVSVTLPLRNTISSAYFVLWKLGDVCGCVSQTPTDEPSAPL